MPAQPTIVKDNSEASNLPKKNTSGGFKEFSHYARVIAICGRCKTVYVGYVAVPVLQIEEPYPSEEEAFINFHTRCPRDGALLNWTISVRRKEED